MNHKLSYPYTKCLQDRSTVNENKVIEESLYIVNKNDKEQYTVLCTDSHTNEYIDIIGDKKQHFTAGNIDTINNLKMMIKKPKTHIDANGVIIKEYNITRLKSRKTWNVSISYEGNEFYLNKAEKIPKNKKEETELIKSYEIPIEKEMETYLTNVTNKMCQFFKKKYKNEQSERHIEHIFNNILIEKAQKLVDITS
jgi:hypothetical protein